MSEVKDISSIEGGAFPSLEVLQRYLRGEASAEERAQIEAMLEDDPMMTDAIEGLEMIEDPAVLQRSIQKITHHSRQQLRRQINKRESLIRRQSRITPKNLLPYIGTAAAAIALLITTVYLIRQMGPNMSQVADAQTQKTEAVIAEASPKAESKSEEEASITDSIQLEGAELLGDVTINANSIPSSPPIAQARPTLEERRDQKLQYSSPSEVESITNDAGAINLEDDFVPPPAPEPTIASSTSVPQAPISTGQAVQDLEREEEVALDELDDAIADKEILLEKDSSSPKEYYNAQEVESIPEYEAEPRNGNTASVIKQDRKAKVSKQTSPTEPLYEMAPKRSVEDIQQGQLERAAAITDMIAKAAKHLEAKEYDAAILQLDEVLLTEPQNVVAHHYRAAAYLALGNDEAAQFSLETVVTIGSGENFEADQWALANVYQRLDKKLKSRSLLKQIVKAGGTYAQQAEALLQ